MHRHSLARRRDLDLAATHPLSTPPAALADAGAVDLVTLRLVLRQHLDELRQRGVDERVLRPIEAELRRYDEGVDALVEHQER